MVCMWVDLTLFVHHEVVISIGGGGGGAIYLHTIYFFILSLHITFQFTTWIAAQCCASALSSELIRSRAIQAKDHKTNKWINKHHRHRRRCRCRLHRGMDRLNCLLKERWTESISITMLHNLDWLQTVYLLWFLTLVIVGFLVGSFVFGNRRLDDESYCIFHFNTRKWKKERNRKNQKDRERN